MLQYQKPETICYSSLLNTAFVSLLTFIQASQTQAHCAVTIIFIVRGGLETCLITLHYTLLGFLTSSWVSSPSEGWKSSKPHRRWILCPFSAVSPGSKGKGPGIRRTGPWARFGHSQSPEKHGLFWCRRATAWARTLRSSVGSLFRTLCQPSTQRGNHFVPHHYQLVKAESLPNYFIWEVTP